jgi:N4-gp56 family major capsid protein
MALQTTTSSGLSAEMKTLYDRMLLERTVPNLLHAKFGQPKRIPQGSGRVIEWRTFAGLNTATDALVEGTLYTDLKDLTVTAITGTVAQYGDAVGMSDLVMTTTFDPLLAETTKILAEQASQTIDELVRDVLVAGTTVEYANTRANRGAVTATDTIAEMDGAGSTTAGGSLSDLRLIALTLELNRARRIGGYWQAITHPRVMFDIQATTEWREAQLYNQTNRIFDGSVGEIYGIKFWVTDVAKVFEGEGDSGIDVYSMLVFGQDAFGIVELGGHNLETIYKPLGSAGTADPLNQVATMAWKVTFGTRILQQAFMLRYECAVSTA